MCGIAGILKMDGSPVEPGRIATMTRQLAHRGPDGEGFLERGPVALGHRRLSIIDLDGGQQPMSNEDGQVWVTFNGEIYNFRELRSQLERTGHRFESRCDTEVIVHAYEEWGEQCAAKFRGMFAFVIVDFHRRRLVLARDHFGIKPLFIRFGDGYLAFASELQPLATLEQCKPKICPQSIEHYLRFRVIPHPDTIYKDIVKLPPAHTQVITFDGQVLAPQRYWEVTFQPDHATSDAQWLEQFEDVIRESVNAHLVSDVPFGAFLSGGIDSTLVTQEMSRILDHPVKAFTIGFDQNELSEIPYARQAADQLGVELRCETVQPDIVAILDELVSHYGEPYGDTSAFPTWSVSKLAREEVPMILSGDGADELFGGYSLYDAWASLPRRTIGSDLKQLATHPRPAIRRLLARLTTPDTVRYSTYGDFVALSQNERRELLRTEFHGLTENHCHAYHDAEKRGRHLDPLSKAQYVDLQTYLPCDILAKVDIASMCHGLEVRTPLTDVRVVEFAATLPLRMRRTLDQQGCSTMKVLPKRSLAKHFPSTFVYRSKMGFSIPETAWLRQGTEVRNRLNDIVHHNRSPLFDWLDPLRVRHLVQRFDASSEGVYQLWSILILGTWLQQHDGIAASTAAA